MIDIQIASLDHPARRSAGARCRGRRWWPDTLRGSGRLIYAAAGSSGLMALADGSELPGTFGIDPSASLIRMAGGIPTDARMPGDTEDLTDDALTSLPVTC